MPLDDHNQVQQNEPLELDEEKNSVLLRLTSTPAETPPAPAPTGPELALLLEHATATSDPIVVQICGSSQCSHGISQKVTCRLSIVSVTLAGRSIFGLLDNCLVLAPVTT